MIITSIKVVQRSLSVVSLVDDHGSFNDTCMVRRDIHVSDVWCLELSWEVLCDYHLVPGVGYLVEISVSDGLDLRWDYSS